MGRCPLLSASASRRGFLGGGRIGDDRRDSVGFSVFVLFVLLFVDEAPWCDWLRRGLLLVGAVSDGQGLGVNRLCARACASASLFPLTPPRRSKASISHRFPQRPSLT